MEFESESEAIEWVIRNQFGRRNLPAYQRTKLALLLEAEIASRAKQNQIASGGAVPQTSAEPVETRKEVAKLAGVSHDTVAKVKKIEQWADEETKCKLSSGEESINSAYKAARREEQKSIVSEISEIQAQDVEGEYDVIVLDPPWPMQKIDRDCRPNQAGFDYPTMSESELELIELPVAEDSHVFIWTTQKFLPMTLRLIQSWGLRYVLTMVWHKPGGFQPIGLPQYNCEFAVYARHGSPKFDDTKAFPTCFNAPRGKHSEKPEEFYELLRRVTGGKRLDMFNRRSIEGFDGWGNESNG